MRGSDPALPETLEELLAYIERYADTIFVREQIDGQWGSHALSALPAKQALSNAFRWIAEGIVPVRLLSDEEAALKKNQTLAQGVRPDAAGGKQ